MALNYLNISEADSLSYYHPILLCWWDPHSVFISIVITSGYFVLIYCYHLYFWCKMNYLVEDDLSKHLDLTHYGRGSETFWGEVLHIFDLQWNFVQIYSEVSPTEFYELTPSCMCFELQPPVQNPIFSQNKMLRKNGFVLHFAGQAFTCMPLLIQEKLCSN